VSQLLLVEDDPEIRRALIRALSELGHAVTSTGRGLAALQHVLDHCPDLVVLDLGLPDVDGTELLRMMRSVRDVPVVIATAQDDEAQIVRALDYGADDYIIKPFGAAQLDARIRAVLRRAQTAEPAAGPPSFVVGELRLDSASREATLSGVTLDLSAREFDVLSFLAARAGTVVTKRDLLTHVWRQPWGGADKTVDVHLSWIRRKLGETAQQPRYLHTVRGVGVRLAAPTNGAPTGSAPTSVGP
jgi:DNA-binding response OmpR family regulator